MSCDLYEQLLLLKQIYFFTHSSNIFLLTSNRWKNLKLIVILIFFKRVKTVLIDFYKLLRLDSVFNVSCEKV